MRILVEGAFLTFAKVMASGTSPRNRNHAPRSPRSLLSWLVLEAVHPELRIDRPRELQRFEGLSLRIPLSPLATGNVESHAELVHQAAFFRIRQ
jgi:hypothetical protein